MEGLGVVTVGFAKAGGRKVPGDKCLGVHGCEADVGEAALVGPPRGIPQDKRQNVHANVVVEWPPHGTTDQESPVAATEVYHQRDLASEEGFVVERAFGWELFEGGSRPASGVEYFACDGYAELAFNASRIFHVPYSSPAP